MTEDKKLEYSDFNKYPHYVYATAFLVNGHLWAKCEGCNMSIIQ